MTNRKEPGRVTDRLPDPVPGEPDNRVTDRLSDSGWPGAPSRTSSGRVTDRLEPAPASPPSPIPAPEVVSPTFPDLVPGRIWAEQYRIEEGPIGAETGEALVFKGWDLIGEEHVALKLYKGSLSPKPEVMDRLVAIVHPSLVALRDFGWSEGRFYEVQEFCQGGSVADYIPYSENELKGFLPQILAGLRFCHDQGIVHRDLKPTNLLFRDAGRTQAAISDFGISSHLDENQDSKKTRTFMVFTLDYCPPEQLRLRQVGPAADYYSLGITLIHLLTGQSPFEGLTEDEIVDRHLAGAIPLPETASMEFTRLIRGLTRQNPKTRWGYNQIRSWLFGEPILRDDGRPDADEPVYGKGIQYPECPEASTPFELARCLDRFDAAGDLFRGRIRLWIQMFDAELAARVEEIEEHYTHDPPLGLFKLRHTLDPTLAFDVGGRSLKSVAELAACLADPDETFRHDLKTAWLDGRVDAWIEGAFPDRADLAQKIREFRKKHPEPRSVGLEQLLFLVDPAAPLALAPGERFRTPEDLVQALIDRPALREPAKKYLFSGQLALWLETAFPNRSQDAAFTSAVTQGYAQNRDLGMLALIWYFRPDHPLVHVGSAQISDPRNLAEAMDRSPEGHDAGLTLLVNGHLRTWLWATGRLPDPAPLDRVLTSDKFSPAVKLEMVLKLLAPDLPRPQAETDTNLVDFGDVTVGRKEQRTFTVENKGRGHLYGRVRVDGLGPEATVAPMLIDGNRTVVTVAINPPPYLKPGLTREGTIVVETNGGGLTMPLRYQVQYEIGEPDLDPDPAPALGPESKVKRLFKWLG